MQAKLLKMAKGSSGESTGGSHQAQVEASPHMSVARSQATATTVSPARGARELRKGERTSNYPKIRRKGGWNTTRKTCLL